MLTHLSHHAKAGIFYALAVGLAVVVALLAPTLGADGTGLLHMLTALAAVLLMLLVVTRDGYHKAGWQALSLQRAGFASWGLALLGPLLILGVKEAMKV